MLISITGTESTGKTTLANQLAQHYGAGLVPDISRMVMERIGSNYTAVDVANIAAEIIEREDALLKQSKEAIIISDNCLFNIQIWLEYYRWETPEWLKDVLVQRKSDLYLLCDIDLDWVPDDQRKNPHDRETLLVKFMEEMSSKGVNYKLISGSGPDRLKAAVQQIDNFINYLES